MIDHASVIQQVNTRLKQNLVLSSHAHGTHNLTQANMHHMQVVQPLDISIRLSFLVMAREIKAD